MNSGLVIGLGPVDEPAKDGSEGQGDFVRNVVPSYSWCGRGARCSYVRAKLLL